MAASTPTPRLIRTRSSNGRRSGEDSSPCKPGSLPLAILLFSVVSTASACAYRTVPRCRVLLNMSGRFQPAIVQGLGYSSTRAQLFTVPPYAVACVLTFVVAYLSDRLWSRGPVILCCLPIAIAGYAMARLLTSYFDSCDADVSLQISTVQSNSAKYGKFWQQKRHIMADLRFRRSLLDGNWSILRHSCYPRLANRK